MASAWTTCPAWKAGAAGAFPEACPRTRPTSEQRPPSLRQGVQLEQALQQVARALPRKMVLVDGVDPAAADQLRDRGVGGVPQLGRASLGKGPRIGPVGPELAANKQRAGVASQPACAGREARRGRE